MLEIENHGAVREIRLARAPVNALGRELLERFAAALDEALELAEAGRGPRSLVISGAPGMFSAGLDVREVLGGEASVRALVTAFFAVQSRLVRSPLPIVAAITGHCPAGGAVLSLLCDHRIMAEGSYRIGLNEVQVGLYPGEMIYRVFARVVGAARAAALLPRGVMLDPVGAREAGLIDEIVPATQVVPRAIALAAELAALPPLAYGRTRALARADLRAIFDTPTESFDELLASGWVTDETRERMLAVLAQGRSST